MSDILENTPETFERLVNETNEYKDKYLRAVADHDNYKKRLHREKEDAIKFSNEKLAKDLLDSLDNFENALKVEMTDDVRMGIELIYKGLLSTLQKHGIVECTTKTFDPNFHEAVSKVDAGLSENSIVTVLRKGYVLGNRLLRPAVVTIQGT
jgi:molecular chaperone GrpE